MLSLVAAQSAVRSSRIDASAAAAAAAADSGSKDVTTDEDKDEVEDEASGDEAPEAEAGSKRTRSAAARDASETNARATGIARAGLGAVLRQAAASGGMDGVRVLDGAGSASSGTAQEDDDDSIAGSVDSLGGDEALDDEEVEAMAGVMEAEAPEEDEAEEGADGEANVAAAAAVERRRAAALRERRGRRLFKGLTIFLNREVSARRWGGDTGIEQCLLSYHVCNCPVHLFLLVSGRLLLLVSIAVSWFVVLPSAGASRAVRIRCPGVCREARMGGCGLPH